MGPLVRHDFRPRQAAGKRPVQGIVKGLGNRGAHSQLEAHQGHRGERCRVPEARHGAHLWSGEAVTAREPFPGRLRLRSRTREDAMNNSSMFTADRATHLKIVVVSLLCATIVAGIGIAARVTDASATRIEATVIKAGKPVTASNDASTSIR